MGQVVQGSSPSFEKHPSGQDAKNKRYVKFVLNLEAMINLRLLRKYNLYTFAAGNIFGTDFWSSCCSWWTWNTYRLSFSALVGALRALDTFFQRRIVISTGWTIDFSSMFSIK